MKRPYWLLGIGLIAGCLLIEPQYRNAPEGPHSWRIGYADGCTTGKLDALGYGHFEQDKNRYKVDDLYREGWKKGHDECFADATSVARTTDTPTPEEASPTPTMTVPPTPEPTKSRDSKRRQEVEERMKDLQSELKSLEGELKELPK